MEIRDLLKKDLMVLDLKAETKEEAIKEIAKKFFDQGYVKSAEDFAEGLREREAQGSTALGESVAIPHSKNKTVIEPAVLFARKKTGLDYDALDGMPTEIFFAIGAPDGENNLHVATLAELSKMIMKDGFIDDLKKVNNEDEVYAVIEKYSEKEKQSQKEPEKKQEVESAINLLAVTACPNGIAHTYMAQEALEKAAKARGVNIKVETNGSDGIKNRLTSSEIEKADAIIIAADKKVETARFNGKKVIQRSVSDGIRKADELVDRAIKGEANIYHEEGGQVQKFEEGQSIGRKIYGDLMNGISHMLPFVIGGGILLAISFLFERFLGEKSTVFTFLNGLGGDAFTFLIPILAGYISFSIADRPGLMPGMVAGLMASRGAGFIGGLIGGFVAGYIVNYLKKATKNLPKSVEGLKPMLIYPVLGLLIVGAIMFFVIDPVFTGVNNFINNWLMSLSGTNMVLLGALLAGMMAIDMGGPINKAAYAFAIGAFTDTGIGTFMAAVMVGGMVPPIAIAIATTFFKRKFNEEQKNTTITNYILGASFITEGAIPFAAAEPTRVLPSCIIGSAIAGAIVGYFGINAPAPHGGIFILPAMGSLNQALLFVGAVLIGAIIGGLILGTIKKKPETQA
ncbi:fructose-specific PTS transporter subunit EIIC [uncultured Anaerococcus sp.]|uniref:PTS fructose transporter subunit IIABC n=1 Tax=uncultured Anaerococcus sp. TaxID=293428 RepID=UPI00288ADB8C|nr:fructose-specific PTS transporter subunit EIIC [uncultured Anaerococcus sp.]